MSKNAKIYILSVVAGLTAGVVLALVNEGLGVILMLVFGMILISGELWPFKHIPTVQWRDYPKFSYSFEEGEFFTSLLFIRSALFIVCFILGVAGGLWLKGA